ncbi:MAG: FG-GAP-like repeat-containing protein [Candidatus Solibacter sp.]|nr:FG-GAP-like repeat-containing protein [Candidatus Solibacter sp.]
MESLRSVRTVIVIAATALCGIGWVLSAPLSRAGEDRLWRYRNLGKAFYENPTTQKQAVEEFRKARDLAPDSARETLNYGLALLRAGDVAAGVAELEKAKKLDPKIPHTWFNLGIAFKRRAEFDRALPQFQQMARLVPNDPAVHYQLGALHKLGNDLAAATREFERTRELNPRLAAPHFQLYGIYRQSNRPADAAAELQKFQELKKQQEGAAVPEDMEWNVYCEIYDAPPVPASAPPATAVYRQEKLAAGFGGDASGTAVFAADGGVRPSLIAWGNGRVTLFRNGVKAAADAGLDALRDVVSVAPGDFDNDGLPDLCVVTAHAALLYRNTGGRFQLHAELARGTFRKAVWVDFDHDYDADLLLVGDESRLLRNNGEAGFSDESKRFPFAPEKALDAVRFDAEPDTQGLDLAVSYAGRAGVLYRDGLGGAYTAEDLAELPAGALGLAAGDVNHDGRTDLAARLPDGQRLLLLNRDSKFGAGTAPKATEFPFIQPVDFEGKGRGDYASIATDGVLNLGRNVTTAYGNWIEIALTGVKNAKLAVGAVIEVKAGTDYRKLTYEGVPVVVRLGGRMQVDTVRISWPNGLIQNETGLAMNRVAAIKEAPRLSGSCPMIFTWNGERFQFITDVLGVAPLGASSGDGQYFPVDHDEYVSIPGEALRARGGEYEIRVTEELREVSYLDKIQLLALDHPAGVEMVTNEKFKSPPFPEFRLFGVPQRVYPVTARDERSGDMRAALAQRDRVYPDAFRRDPAGIAEMHHLDLDFGNAAAANRAALILSGWVDWADGSTFLSATQAHKDLTFPYLQVKDAAGNWKTVVEDMGIPAGKPKTIAVDLTGKFLSASREVRIVTNLCVYWDEIFLIENSAPPASRLTGVETMAADLHFRGFSKAAIHPERKQPEGFDYARVSATSMWNPTSGNYTRYGAVEKLLAEADDRLVILGSGDELQLRFRAAGLPDLPVGWKRDFLLLVDGWAKDADANTAFSQSVLPLPFHSMSRYPYPAGERYPDDAEHAQYQREYNTRPALRLLRRLAE